MNKKLKRLPLLIALAVLSVWLFVSLIMMGVVWLLGHDDPFSGLFKTIEDITGKDLKDSMKVPKIDK